MEKVRESEIQFRGGKSGVKYLFRGPKIDWGVICLLPGETLSTHYHREVEETFYMVEGEVALYTGGARHSLGPGDAVRLPAPEQHRMVNEAQQPAKMIFIKCPYLPADKIDI